MCILNSGKEIGIAVFVFVILLIAIGVLACYIKKRKQGGEYGNDASVKRKKSGTFVPDFTGFNSYIFMKQQFSVVVFYV